MSRKLNVSALAAKAESGNNSSVRRIETLNMDLVDLLLEEPFKSLFPIRDDIKNAIKSHMHEHGYDESKPIDVWKRPSQDGFEYVLVDGFTRASAAQEIGRLTVTAYLHDFANVEEARNYAIHTQRDRRNLTDAEIMSVLGVIDEKVTGFKGSSPLASSDANGENPGKTAQRTARQIGTSARKVEKARKVASDADIAAAVKRGEISINKGYNEIRAKEKQTAGRSDPEVQSFDDQAEAGGRDDVEPTLNEPIDLNSMMERLRVELGIEVGFSMEESGKSGQIILCFVNHNQLQKIVSHICRPGNVARVE